MASLPNGSTVDIAASYGAAKAMTAISNANPAVATLAASHGVVVSDILELTSGWERLNKRIARASVVATNDVTLEGINTVSTSRYPAGSGVGSVREIATWANIPNILEPASSGGEQQYVEFQYLSSRTQESLATIRSAEGLSFNIADDPALAIYQTLEEADEDQGARAVRITLPSGALIFYNTTVSFSSNPSFNINQPMVVRCNLRFIGKLIRYAAA